MLVIANNTIYREMFLKKLKLFILLLNTQNRTRKDKHYEDGKDVKILLLPSARQLGYSLGSGFSSPMSSRVATLFARVITSWIFSCCWSHRRILCCRRPCNKSNTRLCPTPTHRPHLRRYTDTTSWGRWYHQQEQQLHRLVGITSGMFQVASINKSIGQKQC